MADAVHLAISKLDAALGNETMRITCSLLANEMSLLVQIEGSMSRVRREFVVMHAFLGEMDTGKDDRTMEAWLGEVRKLAYVVEDVIDEYVHLTGRQHTSRASGFFANISSRSQNMVDWHNIATQLRDIEVNLAHISRVKDHWVKIDKGGGSSSNYVSEIPLHVAVSSHFIDEDEIVGISENKKILIERLASEDPARSVLSVWGMGGLGKTTLVTNVYKSERNKFDCHVWISIPQNYRPENLLRTIIKDIFEGNFETVPFNMHDMDHRGLKAALRNYLEEKRYLIILDDVWSPKAFHDIADAFVSNEHGSRIIITTRIGEVASLATDNHKFQLKSLQEKEAMDLFCNRAFWKEKNRTCPQELQNWARKFVLKCQGLPLAIVSIGSFLSLREKTEPEWRKIYYQLNWEFDNNNNLGHIKQILNLSYNYLPRFLKKCFLYCCIFPESCLLTRKRIARLWIAEGFVEGREAYTMEEVAEDYLKELVHRCMLQVVERNAFGRVKSCRMHDIVRQLAISISKKENFTVICDNLAAVQIGGEARRLSVNSWDGSSQSNINLPRLRSFVAFEMISSASLSSLSSKSRYLTVIDLQGVPITKLPNEVCNLFNLCYLGLRGTKVKVLPKSLGRLHNLQTLDLSFTEIEKLPGNMSKLKKLRHLFAEKVFDLTLGLFRSCRAVQAPKGLCDIKCLQTLQSVEASTDLVKQLGKMTQLRSLRITKVRGIHCAQLCNSLVKMHFLSNLYVLASDDNEVLQFTGWNPPPQYLQKLFLLGRLEEGMVKSPLFRNLGCNLRLLYLRCCGLTEDPLPHISHMCNLVVLSLCRAYDGQQLCYHKGWFPNLKELYLQGMAQLNQVVIENGAIESLEELFMVDLGALKEVPEGIQFLTSLRTLYLKDLHPEFPGWLEGEQGTSKVQHIPTVQYIYQKEGKRFGKRLLPWHKSQ